MLCGSVGINQLGRGHAGTMAERLGCAWMLRDCLRRAVGVGGGAAVRVEVRGQQSPHRAWDFLPRGRSGLGEGVGQRMVWPDSCVKWRSCLGVPRCAPCVCVCAQCVDLDHQTKNGPDGQAGPWVGV